MTKISNISWGGYDKGFYGNRIIKYLKMSNSKTLHMKIRISILTALVLVLFIRTGSMNIWSSTVSVGSKIYSIQDEMYYNSTEF